MEFNQIPSKLIEMGLIKKSPISAHKLDYEKYLEFKKMIQ